MDQYVCDDAGRRVDSTRADGRFNAVVGVEVDTGHPPDVPAWRTLLVECLLPLPDGLAMGDVEISAVTSGTAPVPVLWAYPASALAEVHRSDLGRVSEQD